MKRYLLFVALTAFLAGCSKNSDPAPHSPQLKSIIYFIPDQQGQFREGEKIEYYYSPDGRLTKEDQSEFDVTTNSYSPFSTAFYFYEGNKLKTIEKTYTDGKIKSTTSYVYNGDIVSEINQHDEIDTNASIEYLSGGKLKITYTFSNGRWFIYQFTTTGGNIGFEQTIGDDQRLSSEVTNEFDNSNNPLKLLGYTDLLFANFSANNKIKTTSEYYANAFPQNTPIAYEYKYNDVNYPVEQITTFQSTGQSGATFNSKTVFDYW